MYSFYTEVLTYFRKYGSIYPYWKYFQTSVQCTSGSTSYNVLPSVLPYNVSSSCTILCTKIEYVYTYGNVYCTDYNVLSYLSTFESTLESTKVLPKVLPEVQYVLHTLYCRKKALPYIHIFEGTFESKIQYLSSYVPSYLSSGSTVRVQ